MDAEAVAAWCLEQPGASEEQPFGPRVDVYKVAGKVFALLDAERSPARVNLKCDPEYALELRVRHPAITPGYHQNKRHWNSVDLDGTVPDELLRELVELSFRLVVKGLPRAVRLAHDVGD